MSTTQRHVVVIGAGLAGLACALRCADEGARVTVLESRPRVGGATWSFERNGLSFDNGQHVFLRCCSAYRAFLERIDATSLAPMQEHLRLPVLRPRADGKDAQVAWIETRHLPAPLHLAPSLARYGYLSVADRLRTGRAVRALQRMDLEDPSLDDISFGTFLERHGQSTQTIANLWDLITLPTLNVHAHDASLALAAMVFKTGLLKDRRSADIGWARVPLGELHGTRGARALEKSGATLRTKAKVEAITLTNDDPVQPSVSGVVVDGAHLAADAVVLAVAHEQAADLLPRGAAVDGASLRGLGRSPIIDVHVVYDKKVMHFDIAAGIDSPVQYVFDRTEASGMTPGTGQCVAVSVSNADEEHGERPEVLIDRYTQALGALFPLARTAKVIDAVVSREHAATFRACPGTAKLRPGPQTGFTNLFLAGAWLDTGWPATMEGAVRSGNTAAACVSASQGRRAESTFVAQEVVA